MKNPISSKVHYYFTALCCLSLAAPSLSYAASGAWSNTSSSNWDSNANWTGASFPNGNNQSAAFSGLPTMAANISAVSPITIRTLMLAVTNIQINIDANLFTFASNSGPASVYADTDSLSNGANLNLSGSFLEIFVRNGATYQLNNLTGTGDVHLFGANAVGAATAGIWSIFTAIPNTFAGDI